jgi:hypothetical protein
MMRKESIRIFWKLEYIGALLSDECEEEQENC